MGDLKKQFDEIPEMDKLKRELMAHFQNYLRERQDFIASIPTMDPAWTVPLDIINDIIEPILGDIDKKCPKLFLLFDNIVRSENIRAGAIQFVVRIFSKTKTDPQVYKYFFENNGSYKSGISDKDHKAAIYLGTSGCQAFYSIIENILRNSARHSNKEELEKVKNYSECIMQKRKPSNNLKQLTLTIDCYYNGAGKGKQYEDDFIKVRIYDNLGGWERENDNWVRKEKDRNNEEKIILSLKKINDKTPSIQNKLNIQEPEGKIVDETGKVVQGAWGMKEIRICASFLRGLKIEDYKQEQKPSIITPFIQPKNGRGSLGYQFYLPMVKNLFIVSKNIFDDQSIQKDDLKNSGINIEKDISKILEFQQKGTFTHEFVAVDIDDKENINFLQENISKLPYKLFYLSGNNTTKEIKKIDTRADRKIIKKDDLKKWLKENELFELNKETIETTPTERVILEIYKKWVRYLFSESTYPKLGLYYIKTAKENGEHHKIWNDSISFGIDTNLNNSLKDVKNSVLLNHKFEKLSEFKEKQPLCIIPYTHGISEPFKAIKETLERIRGKNENYGFEALLSYFNALESGITNIVIIDERIFNDAKSKKNIFIPINLARYWFLQNVAILNLEKKREFILKGYKCNDKGNPESTPEELTKKFSSKLKKNDNFFSLIFPEHFKNKIHFLIMHQTIIDTKIGKKEGFNQFLGLLPKEYKPWSVIITSGRGHPPVDDMPPESKFFDFSNLRRVVIDSPNKFLLSKSLSGLKELEGKRNNENSNHICTSRGA